MTATYDSIATTTLGSANSTITFSNIPSTYTDLRIILTNTTGSAGNTTLLRFNNNSATTYSGTFLQGNGSAISSYRLTNESYIYLDYGTVGSSTTIPTFTAVDIFSYTVSINKTVITTSARELNGTGETIAGVGLWRNTASINRIDLTPIVSFNAGTTATLYGITRE